MDPELKDALELVSIFVAIVGGIIAAFSAIRKMGSRTGCSASWPVSSGSASTAGTRPSW